MIGLLPRLLRPWTAIRSISVVLMTVLPFFVRRVGSLLWVVRNLRETRNFRLMSIVSCGMLGEASLLQKLFRNALVSGVRLIRSFNVFAVFLLVSLLLVPAKKSIANVVCYDNETQANTAYSEFQTLCASYAGGGATFGGSVVYTTKGCPSTSDGTTIYITGYQVTYTCDLCTSDSVLQVLNSDTASCAASCKKSNYTCSWSLGEWGGNPYGTAYPSCGSADYSLPGCGTSSASASSSSAGSGGTSSGSGSGAASSGSGSGAASSGSGSGGGSLGSSGSVTNTVYSAGNVNITVTTQATGGSGYDADGNNDISAPIYTDIYYCSDSSLCVRDFTGTLVVNNGGASAASDTLLASIVGKGVLADSAYSARRDSVLSGVLANSTQVFNYLGPIEGYAAQGTGYLEQAVSSLSGVTSMMGSAMSWWATTASDMGTAMSWWASSYRDLDTLTSQSHAVRSSLDSLVSQGSRSDSLDSVLLAAYASGNDSVIATLNKWGAALDSGSGGFDTMTVEGSCDGADCGSDTTASAFGSVDGNSGFGHGSGGGDSIGDTSGVGVPSSFYDSALGNSVAARDTLNSVATQATSMAASFRTATAVPFGDADASCPVGKFSFDPCDTPILGNGDCTVDICSPSYYVAGHHPLYYIGIFMELCAWVIFFLGIRLTKEA